MAFSLGTETLKTSIQIVMGEEDTYFYRLEKTESSSYPQIIAMIEYSDLVEINKALQTLSASVDEDVAAKPDYLENKFRTVDGLEVGYFIHKGSKARWFIKLEAYSDSSVFPREKADFIKAFTIAQIRIEGLMAQRKK